MAYFRAMDDLMHLRANPRATQDMINEVMQRGAQAELALQAGQILAQARGRCIEEANKSAPIDADVTGDVMAMVASLKGADAGRMGREPAPNFGGMSEAEFKRHTRDNYGF
jgi:hypothetical protein